MSLVQVENVSKDYLLGEQRVDALKDVTLNIDEGVFMAIAGPSGSGKSTLLNLIGCIDTPTSGRILIDGARRERPDARSAGGPARAHASASSSRRSTCCRCCRRRRTSSTRCCSSRS